MPVIESAFNLVNCRATTTPGGTFQEVSRDQALESVDSSTFGWTPNQARQRCSNSFQSGTYELIFARVTSTIRPCFG